MTQSAVAFSDSKDSLQAGRELGDALLAELDGHPPDAAVVFASAEFDYSKLLKGLREGCRPAILVGCSSAGEFIQTRRGEQSASAVGLRSTDISFSAAMATDLRGNVEAVAECLAAAFKGAHADPSLYYSALMLSDPFSGGGDDLIEHLNLLTGGRYLFFGGGAGDDARFSKTFVFCNETYAENAVVALEMVSTKPIGLGVKHGWEPASKPYRVTAAAGNRLISLNAEPAADVFERFARSTSQVFDRSEPLSFFLMNVLGIETGSGYKLRVPLQIGDDGSVVCAAEIPEGVVIHFMRATSVSSVDAAAAAADDALKQLGGHKPEVALFFDCVATRLRMGDDFDLELGALQERTGSTKLAGCNTYGQIARSEGQFSGFHNCTAVVCLIPQ